MPVIKHLILSGGAYKGLYALGVLKKLEEQGFYKRDNIESIFATSVGALVGVLIALRLEWDTILDYIIKRPWENIFQLTPDLIFDAMDKKGLLNIDIIISILEKLFSFKKLDIHNITLSQFHEISTIDFHIYILQINEFKIIDFSHATHPDVKLIEAIYMSCSMPFVFQPLYFQGSYMIDGGVLCNFPLQYCIDKYKNVEEMLAVKINTEKIKDDILQTANLFTYGYYLFECLVIRSNIKINIVNSVQIPSNTINLDTAKKIVYDPVLREKYITEGEKYGELFLFYRKSESSV